jgi:uncharacterized protein affecting Mg2+/Co2+ transport
MKKTLSLLSLLLLSVYIFAAGCTLNASVPKDTLVCGESIFLSAYGNAQGNAFLSENFNNGTYGPGWQSTQQAMWNNPCGTGPDGTTHIWMGNSSPVPRILTTASFNLSSCANAGVTICFDMKFATQGDNSPCEGPDEPQEGVYLQYSTDNGATWTTLHYFDPNGGTDPQFINWRNWCFAVPVGALTANTKFRWYQDADSGADYDHWGFDNVVIYCNDPTFNIVWQHDNFNAGPVGGTNPTPVAPHTSTSYVVVMSNGSTTCRDTVNLVVVNPTLEVNAGADTTACNGACVVLHGTANVIQKPAKTPTYQNQEIATVSGTPGFPGFPPFVPAIPGSAYLNMDINITNLNQTTVTNGYITSVCIGSLAMQLGVFGGVDLFDIYLVCPSGDSILLLKDSTITGANLTNTCFVPGGSNITSATSPYSGSYAPAESFDNLSGCNANGVWSLRFVAVINGIALPNGTFNSWSITFNDPEISYPGTFTWTPTAGMTNANTLNPTVCGQPGDYTLTVSDTAGCVTRTDIVNVSDQACCNFSATATPTQTTCGTSTGSIDVTPSIPGIYTYAWSDGPSVSATRTGLAAGTYTVTITSGNCSIIKTTTVGSTGAPTITTTTTGTGCNGATGTATVTVTQGNATGYLWSSGATTATASNLSAGTYTVTVSAGVSCTVTASAVVNATNGIAISVASTSTTCGGSNGTATVTVTSGTATGYIWSNGATNATAANLTAGTYTVTVNDAGGCSATASMVVTGSGGSNVSLTTDKSTICGGDSALVCAPAGYAAYLWNTGQTTQCIYVKQAGNYYLTVTDQGNCTTTSNHLPINLYPQPPVSVSVDGDSLVAYGSVTYQWYLNGQAIPGATTGVLMASASGSYTVLVSDTTGCTALSLPIEISVTTGIDEVGTEAMSIYPNPSYNGNWTLSVSSGWLNGDYEIFDAAGRLVYKAAINASKTDISLSIQSGVYMIRVTKANMAVTQRLIKL